MRMRNIYVTVTVSVSTFNALKVFALVQPGRDVNLIL